MDFERDEVALVETNVDDVTGEVLSRAVERLMDEGALDATITPYFGKKGRAGFAVRVTCERNSEDKFASILVEETGTLGVRVTRSIRLIVPRKVRSASISIGRKSRKVRVKVAKIGKSLRIKGEFEDAKKIAREEKIPLRDVLELVSDQARKELG